MARVRPGSFIAGAFLRRVLALETVILVASFAVLVAVTFADVLLRRVTGSGLLWSRDLGIYANVWLSMLGIGIASGSGSHLRPRFMDHWIRPGWEPCMQRLQEVLAAVGFAVLCWVASRVVAETRSLGDINTVLRWPVWISQLCMPLSFGLAACKHALFAWYTDLRPQDRDETSEAPRA